jgi:site-specific DNA-methyltransferase (adenine-specific)
LPDDETFQKICNEWNELDKYKTIINSANREVVGQYEGDAGGLGGERLGSKGGDITIPATNVAKDWEGWGTALKPAHEPIVMARKPIEGTVAENTLQYGVGGLNIDGTRVGSEMVSTHSNVNSKTGDSGIYGKFGHAVNSEPREGRWPANVILDEEAGQILDEQSGIRKGFASQNCNNQKLYGGNALNQSTTTRDGFKEGYNDEGGASRFFYCPKASKKDRDEAITSDAKSLGHGVGDTCKLCGCRFVGRPAQLCKCDNPIRIYAERKNIHPTVKPTDLMKYLIRLVTPKDGIVLDPFMGSGSTGKAAMQEGMWFVGIEREKEYYEIAKQRIEYEADKRKFW